MAILDRRLIPFIEMLTELGLDWLAFELVDGVRRGREPEESTEALMLARLRVRSGKVEIVEREQVASVDAEPLLGDDQLDWAAHYVDERLTETLAEMSASLENIDGIVEPSLPEEIADGHPTPTIILLVGDDDRKVGRAQVKEAQAQLPKLREALSSWLASTRTDTA